MSADYPRTRWDEFYERHNPPQPEPSSMPAPVTVLDPARHSRYAQRALDDELHTLATTSEGDRNNTLNACAFSLATLVAAGALDETSTRDALRATALRVGLTASETDKTLRSAFGAGLSKPRTITERARSSPPPSSPSPCADPFGGDGGVADVTASLGDADDDAFWSARPLLAHLHAFARARRASPWAVLGVALARLATATPPTIVLPPLVGGNASLNLFVGVVGVSGSGKGAAERVASDAMVLGQHIETMTTGSGEGIAHGFARRDRRGEQHVVSTAVLFSVPEIDTLTALTGRKGATLMPELRRGWSGESLGFGYADPTKRLKIEQHSYRMCLVAGIQPARAGALLDDADGGTPQRFIWVPAADTAAPDSPPDCPSPWVWKPPTWTPLHQRVGGRTVVDVCPQARDVIDAARLSRLRGDGAALDGHALLAQLKTAAVLGIADGRLSVSDDDWALAGVIAEQSTRVRDAVGRVLADAAAQRNRARAEADAERAALVADREDERAVSNCARSVLRKLASVDDAARSDLRRAVHRGRERASTRRSTTCSALGRSSKKRCRTAADSGWASDAR